MRLKDVAKNVIDRLPDESSLDDIMHALYITAKFERGEDQIRRGLGVSHEEAKKKLQKWLR
jgi:predicted transcriptional regulator